MTNVEELLLDCLHRDTGRLTPERLAQLTAADWHDLLRLARQLRVRPVVAQRLARPDVRHGVPPPILESLLTACRAIAQRNLRLHAELARLLGILQNEGIPVIVLKGMHLATAVYGNPALREIGDMDILVPGEQLVRATSAALAAGYAPRKPFDVAVDIAVSQHVSTLYRPPMYALEIHWNLTEPGRSYSMDPSEIWRHPVSVRLAGIETLALPPEELLLYLCVHLAYQHRFESGVRSLCDVAGLVRTRSAGWDWEDIGRRAAERGWTKGVALSLALARDLLGAEIPPEATGERFTWPGRHDVLTVATGQLLGAPPVVPARGGVSVLFAQHGVRQRLQHILRMIFLPRADLRRQYPGVPTAAWGWWVVYILRCRDLLRRHSGKVIRFWVRHDSTVRTVVERQQLVRAYLDV